MNVNLTQTDDSPFGSTIQDGIAAHQEIMARAGFPLTERVVLVAEDQEQLPGSYRVWLDTYTNRALELKGRWVWVDDEGVVHTDTRPIAHFCTPDCGA